MSTYTDKAILFIVLLLTLASRFPLHAVKAEVAVPAERHIAQGFAHIDRFQYEALESLATRMLDTTPLTPSPRTEAYANYFHGVAKLFGGASSYARPYLEKAFTMAVSQKDDSLTAMTLNSLGVLEATVDLNVHAAQQYFMSSFDYARRLNHLKLTARVGCNMAELSLMQNDLTGYTYARQARQWAIDIHDPYVEFHGAYECACFARLMGNNDSALIYLDEAQRLQQAFAYTDVGILHALRALVLADEGRLSEAQTLADSALIISRGEGLAGTDAIYAQAYTAHAQKRWEASNERLHQALQLAQGSSMQTSSAKCYELMAANYRQMGEADLAFSSLERAKQIRERINSIDRAKLVRERQTLFELAHGEHEGKLRAQELRYSRRTNIFLTVLLVLSAFVIVAGVIVYRRRAQLYRSIVSQNLDMVRREEQKNQLIEGLRQQLSEVTAATGTGVHVAAEQASDIFDRLCQLMEQERLWADMQLTRERVAERLGTNRTYLTQIIKENTGGSYTQFVNSYRIQEAVRILSDESRIDYPLKQLCSDLGYSSMTTFYKLFREKVGISPSAYRRSLPNVQ